MRFVVTQKIKFSVSVILAAVLGLSLFGVTRVNAGVIRDCSANSIITCGEQSPSAFINAVQTGQNGKHNDLAAIYAHFGLESTNYDKFVRTAEDGEANQNGTITVNGRVVATNAWSIGRTHFSYASPYKINGKTYYKSNNSRVLQQNLPVMVMFNSKGQMQFAVMKACGNPTTGSPVTPKFSCNLLHKTAVTGQVNTYDFTTDASASSGAKVMRAVYSFGDGSKNITTTSLSTPVRHTFTRSSTVRVAVMVSLPGDQTTVVTSANCEKQVTVTTPFQACVSLDAAILPDDNQRRVKFTVTTNQGNGSTLRDATFDFGDQTPPKMVAPSSPKTVVTEHTYAQPGTYEVSAAVDFNTAQGVQSVNCTKQITLSRQMCAINPTVPANSPECKPCQFNNQISATSNACLPPITTTAVTTPTQLANTGPSETIGLFAAMSVGSALVYRFALRRGLLSRR